MMWCSCGKVGLDPAPYFWRVHGDIEDYQILHEYAEVEDMSHLIVRFDNAKARALGYTAEACYETINKLMARYGIKPTGLGTYEAPDNQNTFDAFGAVYLLASYSDWFSKTVSLYVEYNDYEVPEDCISLLLNTEN